MIGHVMGKGSGAAVGAQTPRSPGEVMEFFQKSSQRANHSALPFTPVRVNVSPIRLPVPESARRLALIKSPLLFEL